METNAVYRWLVVLLAATSFIATLRLWPEPGTNQAVVAATLLAVIVLWISEIVPLFVTALIGSFMLLSLGDFSSTDIFQPYFDPVIVLFLGGFTLARGLQKYRIDHQLAHEILKRMGDNPLVFVPGVLLVTALLSMWVSNTASAAILIPLMLPLSALLNIDTKSAVMLIAIAVSLDFMMPMRTPPGAVAYSTGIVSIRQMIKNGFLVNIGTGLLLVTMSYVFYL